MLLQVSRLVVSDRWAFLAEWEYL